MAAQFNDNDIVITGISGRLPESSNIEEFKQNLMKEIDMVTEDGRYCSINQGQLQRSGKIKDLENFDAFFFRVHPAQAHVMSPQLRLLLEITYEAIIDAGINPFTTRGSRTGVFIGASTTEFWAKDFESTNGYELLGNSRAMFANRISFTFDFIGPSYTLDTGCSSALMAMHQAIAAIRADECDAAIVGGLNLPPKSATFLLQFAKLNMHSRDGKCKVFDAKADGYVRAETIIALYLQKVKDARRVYATVVHTKTGTDGHKSQGITYPNGEMQYQLIRKLYSEAEINPADVVYVEAHGTGTKVGDVEEVNSIDRIFCEDRKTSLLIGSVKSNMGHAEPASGLCSIAKVLIAMETGMIPANLHFDTPNPNILALSEGRIHIVRKATPWNGGLVGINSFGFGGTNVHIILRSNPISKLPPLPDTVELLPKLIVISGRTEEAVHALLDKAKEHRQDNDFISLLHAVHNNDIPRHRIRGYEILGDDGTRELTEMTKCDERRPIWFVFPGLGVQWPGMGRELLGIETFQRSLRQCANTLKPHGIDLMDIIANGTHETYENVMDTFASIVAIQVALVDVLTSLGICPDGIIGHSLGELGCAYSDGAFTLEQTILAAYYRGKSLLDSELEPGTMAVVSLNWEEIKKICPPDIIPTCHNSMDSTTLSGPIASVQTFVEELNNKNIFAKLINNSGFAYHSKYIDPAGPKLRILLDKIIPNPKQRSSRWISTSIPEAEWDSQLAQFSSPEYYVNNMLSPVLFWEAMAYIPENAITIEITPHCLLHAILRKSLSPTVTNIGLQNRNHPNNLIFLLSNLGKLYMAGAQPDISKLYPPVSFPVGRGTPMIGPLIKWDHSVSWKVLNYEETSKQWGKYVVQVDLSKETNAYLAGHQIDGQIVFPDVGYIPLVWKTFAQLQDIDFERLPVVLENVWFRRSIVIPKEGALKFSINIFEGTGDFEICESGTIAVSGSIRASKIVETDQLKLSPPSLPSIDNETLPLNTKDIYKELWLRGYEYCGIFQGIKFCDSCATIGELRWFNEWIPYINTMFQFSMLGDNGKLQHASHIQYVAIDPILHKQLIKELSEDGGLPVYHYKDINIVKSGGIELRGLKSFSVSRRQQIQTNLKHERYLFVPNENLYSLMKDPSMGRLHALTVLLQIVHENMTTFKMKIVEVAGERAAEALLAPLILDIFSYEISFVDLQVAAVSTSDYTNFFSQMNVNVVARDTNNEPPAHDMHLVIATNVLSNRSYTVLKNLTAALKTNGFILLEESAAQLDLKIALKEANLILVGKQIDAVGKSYFLLKKQKKIGKPIVIKITEKNLSWLENIKSALKEIEREDQEVLVVSQDEPLSGIIGLMNCIRFEMNGATCANVRYAFIQDKDAPEFDLSAQFYANQLDKGLTANVLKNGKWGSYRYLRLNQLINVPSMQVEHAHVNILMRGNLNTLKWIQSPLNYYRSDKFPNTTLCSIYYVSLNFRDVMLANGKLSSNVLGEKMATEDCVLGIEFSGRDADGRRVMGIVESGGLATTVMANFDFLWEVPDRWTLEQAATIPIAYATGYYALFVRGRSKAGESILIHAGASDVGQAAIALALHAGCTVFTTVSMSEERVYLKRIFPRLADRHIGDSRDTSFEQLILTMTRGRGVDVVLNSLTDEKFRAGIRCLAMNGRFLEIGESDLLNDNRISMSMSFKNATFHSISLNALLENHAENREVISLVTEGIENGVVRPLSTTVFPGQQPKLAFEFMATEKQRIGKVLLRIRDEEPEKRVMPMARTVTAVSRVYMHPEKSYVIVGGLGGFGLELVDWMIIRGAKYIVLVSRSGIRIGYQALCVRRWRESGVKIIVSTTDVTTLSGAERLIAESNQLVPIGGIFNLTIVLRDALIENLTEADFKVVMLPKINITRNLDTVLRKFCPLLDYFVVFSSRLSGRGTLGQSNYGFANNAMERMMERRQADGLPALAIQWGPIADVGFIIDTMRWNNNTVVNGVLPQRISSCLATMDIFLQQPHPVLASSVIAKKHRSVDRGSTISPVEAVINILGIDIKSINFNDNLDLDSLGIDSLMDMEIKHILETNYDIVLSIQEIRALTIAKLQDLSSWRCLVNAETTKEQKSPVACVMTKTTAKRAAN